MVIKSVPSASQIRMIYTKLTGDVVWKDFANYMWMSYYTKNRFTIHHKPYEIQVSPCRCSGCQCCRNKQRPKVVFLCLWRCFVIKLWRNVGSYGLESSGGLWHHITNIKFIVTNLIIFFSQNIHIQVVFNLHFHNNTLKSRDKTWSIWLVASFYRSQGRPTEGELEGTMVT